MTNLKKVATGALAALTLGGALTAVSATPAAAQWRGHGGYGGFHGGYGGYRGGYGYRGGGYGGAVVAGLAGLAVGSALAGGYGYGGYYGGYPYYGGYYPGYYGGYYGPRYGYGYGYYRHPYWRRW